jgi:hypothetical protein
MIQTRDLSPTMLMFDLDESVLLLAPVRAHVVHLKWPIRQRLRVWNFHPVAHGFAVEEHLRMPH